jgi:hypothetical protein
MMGSIPLPALGLQTPQQPDLLSKYGQLMQLKNMQTQTQLAQQEAPLRMQQLQQGVQQGGLQLQQQQQALKDEQAKTAAMGQWNGKDYNDLYPLIQKNGGSASAIMGLKSQVLEHQQKAAVAFKDTADGGKAQVETLKQKNDLLGGALTPLTDPQQVPDATLSQALDATVQGLVSKGLLDPQGAQAAEQLKQSGDPNAIRQGISQFIKSHMALTQITEQAQKQAETAKDTAQAGEATANANFKNQEIQSGGTAAMADSRYRNILMNQKLGRPVTPDDQAFLSAYKQQKTLVPAFSFNLQNQGATGPGGQPSAIAKAIADGSMKWGDAVSPRMPLSVKAQLLSEVKGLNPQFNSGDFDIEKKVREDFTSGTDSNSLTAINRAREHMGVFIQSAKDLDNGNVQSLNKLGNAISTEFGSDKATNLNIAKQAFSAEVGKAFAGASVAEGDRTELQKSISTASSFQQLSGAAKTADSLLAGAQKVLKQKYDQGRQGNPNFGDGTPSTADPFAQFGGKAH